MLKKTKNIKAEKLPIVFFLEDNIAYRMLMEKILERKGFLVQTFEDGKKALRLMNHIKPDLIISDIEMPNMDGFEFHKVVNQKFGIHTIPFIYISSTSCEHNKKKATAMGATLILEKPVSPKDLEYSIQNVKAMVA